MTKEELKFVMLCGLSLTELFSVEIRVGGHYKGVGKDGEVFIFKCLDIDSGDCFGEGVTIQNEFDSISDVTYYKNDLFCKTSDVIAPIPKKAFDTVMHNLANSLRDGKSD